mgnify:FL=1|tara:strand:+ start:5959 stop:7173 length:1215 start_codon:yes stop_codon:yes gene_type:complete
MTTEEIKELQRELGVTPDGIIGPITRAAAKERMDKVRSASEGMFVEERFGDIVDTTGLVRGEDASIPVSDTTGQADEEEDDGGEEEVVTGGSEDLISETEDKLQTLIDAWLQNQNNNNLYNPPTADQFAFQQDDEEYIPTIDEAKNLYPYYPEKLVQMILDVWTNTGEISIAISETRASDEFDKQFPGIKRPDGSLRMTEIEYLETKDYMQDSLRRYNLNPEVFGEDIINAISGDVSAKEFDERVNLGYTQIINNIPQVKEIYKGEFGMDLTDEAIIAMFLSPSVAESVLENRVLVSSISAEAEVAGVNIGKSAVQQFIQAGINQEESRQLFGQVAEVSPGLQFSAAAQGTQLSQEQVARGLAGLSPEELQNIRGIATRAESASSAELGAKQTQAGEVTGLIEG